MRGDRHVVVTVHGIRTYGKLQELLEQLIRNADPDIEFIAYKYGYVSVIAFMIPLLRLLVTRRFRQDLVRVHDSHPEARIDLVGHSFGTHLIAWSLVHLARLRYHRTHGGVICCLTR